MTGFESVLRRRLEQVSDATAQFGLRVDVSALGICDRRGQLELDAPTRISPNRACRMVRAADGWIAINLAREEDHELVPAWLRGDFGEDVWGQVERLAPRRTKADLVADGILLGLPVAAVGEVRCEVLGAPIIIEGPKASRPVGKPLKVIDLSAMWAGPMCGAILAAMGADVIRVESKARPDPTRSHTPEFFQRLNGAKTDILVDFSDPAHVSWLREEMLSADIVVSGSRPRGLASLGLKPRDYLQKKPGGVWIAITGYGWYGPPSDRVAFGDDASAAGGLIEWNDQGEPRFLGDALADPVTGLAGAIVGLQALLEQGGRIVSASMAHCASGAAFEAGLWR